MWAYNIKVWILLNLIEFRWTFISLKWLCLLGYLNVTKNRGDVKKGVLAIPLRDHTKGSFQINDEGFLIYSEPIFSKKREVTKETVISTDKNEAPVILTGIISALNRHQHLNRLKRIFYIVIFFVRYMPWWIDQILKVCQW